VPIALTWGSRMLTGAMPAVAPSRGLPMMTSPPMIGVIGLGLLGMALARRLVAASYPVIGYDIDAARGPALAACGGTPATSIAEVARAATIVLLAVFDTDQVEQVTERDILATVGEASNTTILCAATCDPDRLAALAERVASRGIRFVETPVVGSSAQVAGGDGVALVGGDADVVAAVEPVVAALCPVHFHIGKVGDGGRAKLAVNLILGLNRLALAEGLLFAERIGLDPARFLAVARQSAAYSRAMDTKGGKMVGGDFSPEGRAHQHLKDIKLMLEKADAVGQPLPALRVHADILATLVAHGDGDLDNSAVIAELRRRGDAGAATLESKS
jgi:3-hydroxyisobutyrate dehydrogenase-like beta-hydroxyacid dehydrogenase